ncbi:MAG: alanine--tRNA ligase [Candidatus Micrarchaeia archaeon]
MAENNEMSKDKLREEFGKNYEKHYKVKLFEEEGFERKKCAICGRYFWTADPERTVCEDSAHTPYGFFKDKPEKISYEEFWDRFSGFFKSNGHAIIKRYPVVSRWRQDLYFTIAGIQDFQRIENGVMGFEYPANPLLVPQMCLRFNDIENVGITGRHFTSFMMANQTAFNWPKEGYWKDETIALNFGLLTKVLGLKKEDIVYHEDVWAMPDFSEFGPSLETFSKGLEIVNSVFTEFEYANGQVRDLKNKVIDVGWGFERALWFYTGYDNAYEAAFHSVVERIGRESGISIDTKLYRKFAELAGSLDITEMQNIGGKIEAILARAGISKEQYEREIKPVQGIYAIVDHVRTLLFAVTDGALPSNIGGGYNLRVILRRAFEFEKAYGIKMGLADIAKMIAGELKGIYPELSEGIDTFGKVVQVESGRYAKTMENAAKIAASVLSKEKEISKAELRKLYESNGITPEMLEQVALSKGMSIKLPENAYSSILVGDMVKKEKAAKIEMGGAEHELGSLPKTKQLFYDFVTRSNSKVVYAKGAYVVLDSTPFYPEGGGQAPDLGTIGGARVVDVQKVGDVIVHVLGEPKRLGVGETVSAEVDEDRRNRLIAHHTATHLISAAARKVLGKHAWQEGAKKEPDKAHIDIAHYERLSDKELDAIENQVNAWLLAGIKVEANVMGRGEAESKYGFSIYQGHGVPAKEMRIITIKSKDGNLIDAEACGGLHAVGREYLIGLVKIISSSRIHDGVDRIEFVAGKSAAEYFQKEHRAIASMSSKLNADFYGAEKKLDELLESNARNAKAYEKGVEALARAVASAYNGQSELVLSIDLPAEILVKVANEIAKGNSKSVVLLENKEGNVVCIAGKDSGKSALEFVKGKVPGFSGGGSDKFAQGKKK